MYIHCTRCRWHVRQAAKRPCKYRRPEHTAATPACRALWVHIMALLAGRVTSTLHIRRLIIHLSHNLPPKLRLPTFKDPAKVCGVGRRCCSSTLPPSHSTSATEYQGVKKSRHRKLVPSEMLL